jgi:hypothetical protein
LTFSARAKRIDEGREADYPDRGKDNEALPWPRPADNRNVLNDRHHDETDDKCGRQERSDGEREGHSEGTPVETHVRDRNPTRPQSWAIGLTRHLTTRDAVGTR